MRAGARAGRNEVDVRKAIVLVFLMLPALAAQAETPVTMPVVLEAARTEFRKLERPINEADFRWQEAVARGL